MNSLKTKIKSNRTEQNRTYHSIRLHAQHQGVRGHVARVGQGVLLPQLAEHVGGAGHVGVGEHEVSLEEDVDRARWEGERELENNISE
jgi:hypothetical protein